MEKLKERLDMFSDAVFAIILTLMAIELPIPTNNSSQEYLELAKAIGVLFISYCFIANIWYQHALLLGQIKKIKSKIVIIDLILLAFLTLIPSFTKMMTLDMNKITVMSYGILTILINTISNFLAYEIIRIRYVNSQDIVTEYRKTFGPNKLLSSSFLSFILVVVAFFYPNIAVVFFIIVPIISFISNMKETEELTGLSEMTFDDRRRFANLSRKEQIEERRKWRNKTRLESRQAEHTAKMEGEDLRQFRRSQREKEKIEEGQLKHQRKTERNQRKDNS